MPTKSKKPEVSYRELAMQLDGVLAKLQNPELDIDEATKMYEEGLQIVARLEAHLRQAENSIETIRAGASAEMSGE